MHIILKKKSITASKKLFYFADITRPCRKGKNDYLIISHFIPTNTLSTNVIAFDLNILDVKLTKESVARPVSVLMFLVLFTSLLGLLAHIDGEPWTDHPIQKHTHT